MNCFLPFFFVSTIRYGSCEFYEPSLAILFRNLSNDYFELNSRIIFLQDQELNSEFLESLIVGHSAPITLFDSRMPPLSILKSINAERSDSIITLGSGLLSSGNVDLSFLQWNSGGKVLLIMKGDRERAKTILQTAWRLSRTHKVIVANVIDTKVEFYGWTPYHSGDCNNITQINVLDVWQDEAFLKNATFYRQPELSDLNSCPLFYTSSIIPPYVMLNFTRGLEIRILQELEKCFNFKRKYITMDFLLISSTNKTTLEAMEILLKQKADLAFGGIPTLIDGNDWSEPLYPHMMENIVWLVPAPVQSWNTAENSFLAFAVPTWTLIWATMLVVAGAASFIHYVLDKKSPTFGSSWSYAASLFLNGTPTFTPKSFSLRLLTLSSAVFYIHIYHAYQSSLLSILMTSRYEDSFSNINDLVSGGNLQCYVHRSSDVFLKNLDKTDPLVPRKYLLIDESSSSNAFQAVAYKRSAYFLLPKSQASYLIEVEYKNDNAKNLLRVLDEPVMMLLPVSFHMSPKNPLAPLFNEKIQQLVESGLVKHWSHHILADHNRSGTTTHLHFENKLKPLSVKIISGPFASWAFNCFLTLVPFFIELYMNKRG